VFFFVARFFAPLSAGEPEFSGEIVIGATFPRTGWLEDYGLSAYYGANTAAKMVNEAGGINGKRLVLEWRDNQSNPLLADAQIRELVEKHHVPAILGPLMSDSTLRVQPTARELEVVVMSPMSTVEELAEEDPWVFRAFFGNAAEAEALARFQSDKYGAATCVILYDSRHAVSRELADIMREKMSDMGGSCLGVASIIDRQGRKDYYTAMNFVAELAPDFVFAPVHAVEATELLQTAKTLGITTRFCGSHTWDNQIVFEGTGVRLSGTSFASALFEQAFSRSFRVFYNAMEQAGMDTPDASAVCGYDAVMLLAQALKNGETPEEIRQGLLQINNLMLATGRISITNEGGAIKSVLVRVVERIGYRMEPVYAERYDSPHPAAQR
jgi:ABC-type branched-chain amino acid transport systems, periplasmic component